MNDSFSVEIHSTRQDENRWRSRVLLWAVLAIASTSLLVHSQTLAYYADEGFDVLAAELVLAGKRPYLDFFYQHTPLFTYLTAAWMGLWGKGWHSAHMLSALFTAGSIWLVAHLIVSGLGDLDTGWRSVAAAVAAVFLGGQTLVLRFGTIGQAYGACLFFGVATVWCAVHALNRSSRLLVSGAGVCAGAAAACSLLAAPVAPIVLAWLMWQSDRRSRFITAAWFLFGTVLPLMPLIWLLAIDPRSVAFDTVLYHLRYRHENWPIQWDLSVFASLLASAQLMILLTFMLVGIFFGTGLGQNIVRVRRDLHLCVLLVVGLTLFAAATRPTFEQYFVPALPFAAILGAVGVVAVASHLLTPAQRPWLALLAVAPFALVPVRLTHALSGGAERSWQMLEEIGAEINRVTPPTGVVWANPLVYVAAGRMPAEGLESETALVLADPPADAASLHIFTLSRAEALLQAGGYDTVCVCENFKRMEDAGISRLYRQHTRVRYVDFSGSFCDIYWDKVTGVH